MIKTEDRERNIQILNEYKEVGVMQIEKLVKTRCNKITKSCYNVYRYETGGLWKKQRKPSTSQ